MSLISDVRSCVRRWAQVFTDGRMPLECGTGQRLILTNVTYEQQGQYICLASNKINGNVREVKSDPVSLQVVGAPRVRRRIVAARRGTLKKFPRKSELPGGVRRWRIAFPADPSRKNIASLLYRDPGIIEYLPHARARGNGISAGEYFAWSPSLSFDCTDGNIGAKKKMNRI